MNNNTNTNGLQVIPLQDQLSFTEWNRTVHLTLHEQGHTKYITTNYTAIIQAVDDYNAKHTAHLFKALNITSTISIALESTSGEKSLAMKVKPEDVKKKQITTFILNKPALKSAHKLCKGRHKTFIFICSTITPKLLEDISGMSNSCPLALWTAINNCYSNNDVALQAMWCDLS